jgi:K+-sensing histidine kinase KdpD
MADFHDADKRPPPNAVPEGARRNGPGLGELRIFVGAAAGVGTTYEMLLKAQDKREDGVDVVIGIVETHGRKETKNCSTASKLFRASGSNIRGARSKRWILTRSLLAARS